VDRSSGSVVRHLDKGPGKELFLIEGDSRRRIRGFTQDLLGDGLTLAMEVDIMAPEAGQVVGQRSSVVVLLVTEDRGPVLVRASLWTSVLMMAGAFILLRYLMKLGIIRLLVVAMLLRVVSSFPWVIIRLLLNLLGP
jgi:hypothetical protein